MLVCYDNAKNKKAIPITLIEQKNFSSWFATQSIEITGWLKATQFREESNLGEVRIVPNERGEISKVFVLVKNSEDMWNVGHLPFVLPEGLYQLENPHELSPIAWGLGSYQFTRYKKPLRAPAQLSLANVSAERQSEIENTVSASYLARDLINTPTDDLGPSQLAAKAQGVAKHFGAQFQQIIGEELLKENYACIYTVGRASDDAPRLVDIRWGNPEHPKVSLVGKGVCFDSGGLDIKPSSYMLLMKKDMAGAAHVLALAHMIMQAKLPISLRVLMPCVENVISGNAYRPGDIIKSRKGITVEVGNTDAEGRLILADALTEAASENPELLIDISTLTGAARVALGPDLPALFSNNDQLVKKIIACGEENQDLMWHMPIYKPYRDYLNSLIADINNISAEPYAGAITAAIFLNEFVPDNVPWLHFDMMAWNIRNRPGRIVGAEAMNLRALFAYLKATYS